MAGVEEPDLGASPPIIDPVEPKGAEALAT
jgi:hypothetical protein